MNEIELKSPFAKYWENKDPFTEVEQLDGEIYRAVKQRKTLKFQLGPQSYFIKIHRGTTLKEIIKNLFAFRQPILDAKPEWNAIHRLQQVGVNTMNGRAFGRQGWSPLTRRSFIITEDLKATISLEELTAHWQTLPPNPVFKRALITYLAKMVAKMHAAGVNHRDCYLCHFLLDEQFANYPRLKEQQSDAALLEYCAKIQLFVIDLHRAQIRTSVPKRWRDKDLIGLYFSSRQIGLTQRDIYLFLKTYFNKPLAAVFRDEKQLIANAARKAERIRQRTEKYHL
ncbi:lipopolysaccharide core heptose(I) kinase RfaP [Orbaceae bacterium ESL0727]|nr:lipopolysaccharide core heptose(I) kinase RfaP [Orbaceae bacterium ESL0727]